MITPVPRINRTFLLLANTSACLRPPAGRAVCSASRGGPACLGLHTHGMPSHRPRTLLPRRPCS